MLVVLVMLGTCWGRMLPLKKQVKEMDAVTTLHPEEQFNKTMAELVESKIQFLNALEAIMLRNKINFFNGLEASFNSSVDQFMINRQRIKAAKQHVKMALAPPVFQLAADWSQLSDAVKESKKKLMASIVAKWKSLQTPKTPTTSKFVFVPMPYGSMPPFTESELYQLFGEDNQ